MFFTLTGPSRIITVPVDQFAVSGERSMDIIFETDLHALKRVMPYDDRLLAFRITDCELVAKGERIYTESMKRVLRADWRLNPGPDSEDIVDSRLHPEVELGTGWYPRETDNGTPFRWMADGAEIAIEGVHMEPRRIRITGQVGPSAPAGRISIWAELNGKPIADLDVAKGPGARVTLLLAWTSRGLKEACRGGQDVIRLSVKGGGKEIPGDPRVLNFRVFQIRFADSTSGGQTAEERSSVPPLHRRTSSWDSSTTNTISNDQTTTSHNQ
jgi:hypothetical protein